MPRAVYGTDKVRTAGVGALDKVHCRSAAGASWQHQAHLVLGCRLASLCRLGTAYFRKNRASCAPAVDGAGLLEAGVLIRWIHRDLNLEPTDYEFSNIEGLRVLIQHRGKKRHGERDRTQYSQVDSCWIAVV